MKKMFFSIAMLLCVFVQAQELPKIVPPSPNASSLHVYGNNSVNYYSGTVGVSIPIYTINDNGITVPITLRYTGGNGIRVDEQSSWVGLGWALNTGGAISRVKRGTADESTDGFMSYNSLPKEELDSGGNVVNSLELLEISQGKRDGEPDKFSYSLPSVSGSFYINYDEKIHLKPFKNVLITHKRGGVSSEISSANCIPNGNLRSFEVVDEKGTVYTLEDKEYSNSRMLNGAFLNKIGYPSSWYLSKIENKLKTNSITYEYEPYVYKILRLSSNFQSTEEIDSYSEEEYVGKRLKKINFSGGSIEFVKSAITRKDIANESALESIIVRDTKGKQIKKIVFDYGYFTNNSLVPYNSNIAVSNANRLVLNSVKEVSLDGQEKGRHDFIYNTSHFLPSTFSKAKDHWGYYNGQVSNQKFQPKHFFEWYNGVTNSWNIGLYGESNRDPNSTYAASGILKKIIYPTKGSTTFEYEGNQAKDARLANRLIEKNTSLYKIYNSNDSSTYVDFRVDLYSNSVPMTEAVINAFNYYPDQCTPTVYIKSLSDDNKVYTFSFASQGGPSGPGGVGIGSASRKVLLPKGNYRAYFVMNSTTISCVNAEPATIGIRWTNEHNDADKPVGGVRIKKILNDDGLGNLTTREFIYTNDVNESSGTVTNVPEYSYQNYTKVGSTFVPLSYALRLSTSSLPLVTDQGNTVGYSKVTEIVGDGRQGKTEYYFTSSKEYHDSKNGFFESNNQLDKFYYSGKEIKTTPLVEDNSMSYLRGLLLKKIDYKSSNSAYVKVKEEENIYNNLYHYYDKPGMAHAKEVSRIVEGLKIDNGSQSLNSIKKYAIHSGYSVLSEQRVTSYYNGESIRNTTNYHYPENDNIVVRFLPIKTETTNSKGVVLKTETKYAKDVNDIKLINDNRISEPIEVSSYKKEPNNPEALLSKQKTIYNTIHNPGGLYLPSKIQTSKGTGVLEDRVIYHSYDDKGNPTEVSKKDGTRIVYIWGYHKTQPVAKIENATLSEVTVYISNIQAKSNADNDRTIGSLGNEGVLRSALNALRAVSALSKAQITTFTYDSLVGVTSITDPRGQTIYYEYDSFNRLKYVRDNEGKLLKETKYNYKN
ncbi:RHS repeat domain-containing protein [uncultured Tenacibaculum sp.]|uniref:RHS repeat domain-containing protein n=1 Tax=uncultured Tenacibaculum sp. TaxID=174713 RepID=UPI00262AA6D6|nr:RHS repeat domain-containing protein [uncultured Tenacibaculum sp.]